MERAVPPPHSKLDDDAFTRVRVILMNGIETEALRSRVTVTPGWRCTRAAVSRSTGCSRRH